jgi:hypothetical protein
MRNLNILNFEKIKERKTLNEIIQKRALPQQSHRLEKTRFFSTPQNDKTTNRLRLFAPSFELIAHRISTLLGLTIFFISPTHDGTFFLALGLLSFSFFNQTKKTLARTPEQRLSFFVFFSSALAFWTLEIPLGIFVSLVSIVLFSSGDLNSNEVPINKH